MARVEASWFRRQWLKLIAVIEDHPKTAIGLGLLLVGIFTFYAFWLDGFRHFRDSGARWRILNFGGTYRVDRSIRVPDVILSLEDFCPQWDRLDLTTPTTMHVWGTAFRRELREIAAKEGARIRVNAFDPRMGDPEHPRHAEFSALASAFGLKTWEFAERCWHSTAVLVHLHQEFGDVFQVRFIVGRAAGAKAPFFCIGRSGHAYLASDPKQRIDVIVPRPDAPTGTDSFSHHGMIVKDRPRNQQVQRFQESFEALWESGTPMDGALLEELLSRIARPADPGLLP